MKIAALCALLTLTCGMSSAQTDDSWKIYDDSHLPRIEITIDSTLLGWIFAHPESDSEHVATFRFWNSWIDETVDSVGFRLRGNTSRDSKKQSFKVSFNTFVRGREFHGVDRLNLNGEHNDPSIIRAKLCFDLFASIGTTASRANHVELYVNGVYRGLYISVEHVDDEFLRKNFADETGNLWKCLYPADLTYKGASPEIYRDLMGWDRPVYELMTNEEQADFTPLARFISALNNTPGPYLPDSLEELADVHEILKYFAFNVLTGSWDDYWSLMNNYYLYHEPSRERMHLIPYDYDNTFGVDWFGIDWSAANPYNFPPVVGGPRPLAERLLAHATYRDLYTHILEFFRTRVFPLSFWESRVDSLRTMITSAAMLDTFRTLDYGFGSGDFFNSFSETGYQNQHVKFGLKQFVSRRIASIAGQLSTVGSDPIVYAFDFTPRAPRMDDSIHVTASCYASGGVKDVIVRLQREGDSVPIEVPLVFHPVSGTKKVEEADRWTGTLPPIRPAPRGSFRIIVRDMSGRERVYPRVRDVPIEVSNPSTAGILVNEFVADNSSGAVDPSGEYDDWVELYNGGSSPVLLTGMYLTDKPDNLSKWRFTQEALVLEPGGFLVVWCDEQGSQPGIHTNFKLSASGEYIALVDTDGVSIVDSLSFGPQQTDVAYGRYPDGSGDWSFLEPSPGQPNVATGVPEESLPGHFSLAAFPNPFNPHVTIRYVLPSAADVRLSIHDLLGRTVWDLFEPRLSAGRHDVRWDGTGLKHQPLPSGVYILRIQAGSVQMTERLLLLR